MNTEIILGKSLCDNSSCEASCYLFRSILYHEYLAKQTTNMVEHDLFVLNENLYLQLRENIESMINSQFLQH